MNIYVCIYWGLLWCCFWLNFRVPFDDRHSPSGGGSSSSSPLLSVDQVTQCFSYLLLGNIEEGFLMVDVYNLTRGIVNDYAALENALAFEIVCHPDSVLISPDFAELQDHGNGVVRRPLLLQEGA